MKKWTCPACGAKCKVKDKSQKIEHLEDDVNEAIEMQQQGWELEQNAQNELVRLNPVKVKKKKI